MRFLLTPKSITTLKETKQKCKNVKKLNSCALLAEILKSTVAIENIAITQKIKHRITK